VNSHLPTNEIADLAASENSNFRASGVSQECSLFVLSFDFTIASLKLVAFLPILSI